MRSKTLKIAACGCQHLLFDLYAWCEAQKCQKPPSNGFCNRQVLKHALPYSRPPWRHTIIGNCNPRPPSPPLHAWSTWGHQIHVHGQDTCLGCPPTTPRDTLDNARKGALELHQSIYNKGRTTRAIFAQKTPLLCTFGARNSLIER